MIRVASAYFVTTACIAAQNVTHANAEKDRRLSMELIPQGLMVRVVGFPRPFLIGNANLRSLELYEEPEAETSGKRGKAP